MSGSSSGSRIKSIFDSDDESDEEMSPAFATTPSTSDKTSPPKSSSSNAGLSSDIPTKSVTTPDSSAVTTPAQVKSSSSSSRVAASSTAALFARLQKTPPAEIKKASLENKDDLNEQKDVDKKEDLFITSPKFMVRKISDNKNISDLNVLNIRKLDERPKGPKKELLDKFIHMNDKKIEKNTMQIITESTAQKETTKTTDVSGNEQNASMRMEHKIERNRFDPLGLLHDDDSLLDTKENEKSKGDLFNDEVEISGKKEKGEKRGGSPIVADKAEKIAKHDTNTGSEINTEIPEQSVTSAKHIQTSEIPKITIKSSTSTAISVKSEGSPKFICTPTIKAQGSPNIALKSTIAPKLLSSGDNIPKLILKTSSPGTVDGSIGGSKHSLHTTERSESTNKVETISKIILKSGSGTFDKTIESQFPKIKTIESSELSKSVESIPKIIVKKSENSASIGSFGKSPKVTVKNLSFSKNEDSKSSEESSNPAMQTEFTSKIISSVGGNLQLPSKSVCSTSSETYKPMDGSLKTKIGSSRALESSSEDKATEGSLKLKIKKLGQASESSRADEATGAGSRKLPIESSHASELPSVDNATEGSLRSPIKSSKAPESSSVDRAIEGSLKLTIKKATQAIDLSNIDKAIEGSLKSPNKSFKDSESSSVDKITVESLNLTTKKSTQATDLSYVDKATDKSLKLSIKSSKASELSSVDKSIDGSLKSPIILSKASESSSVDKAIEGSLKSPIKSSKASESSSVVKAIEGSLNLTIKKSAKTIDSLNIDKNIEESLKSPISASKASESSNVDRAIDGRFKTPIKSSHASESSSVVKSNTAGLKLTIKKSPETTDSSNVGEATDESLKVTIKSSQSSDSSSVVKTSAESLKFTIKSSQASESSSVIGADNRISSKQYNTADSEVDNKCSPNLKSKSPQHPVDDGMSPMQEKQNIENSNPTIIPYSSNTKDEVKKDAEIVEMQKKEMFNPVSLKLPPKKSFYSNVNLQNISKMEEKAKSNDDDIDNNDEDDDNDDKEYFDTKTFQKESTDTPFIENVSENILKADDKLKKNKEKSYSPEKFSNVDENLKLNVKSPDHEEFPKPSYESKSEGIKEFNISPELVCDEKDNSNRIPTVDHSHKETLEIKKIPTEIITPRRVGKLLLKIPNYPPRDMKENKHQQLGMDLHKKQKEDDVKKPQFPSKGKDISVMSKTELPDSESDEDDDDDDDDDGDIDESKDDRTSEVNTTIASNVDDLGTSDDDSSSDDSSDSDSERTANSTLESQADKGDSETEKERNKEAMDINNSNTDKFREDFINRIEKTSSPIRKNVHQDEEDENHERKKAEQNYSKVEENKNCESAEKEEKSDEVNYDYDELNKDYEEDSDESRMEIVEEEIDETAQKKADEIRMEEVKVDNQNKGEMTVTKLQDNSRLNTTSEIDVETVYRRELDTSSKSGFVKATSTPKNDVSLKKVRVEDVFTDTEDEKEDEESKPLTKDNIQAKYNESTVRKEHDSIHAEVSTKTKDVHEEKSTGIKSKKTSPTPKPEFDMDSIMKPLLRGWKREVVQKSQADNNSVTKTDIYYCSHEGGKRLRSFVEIESHLLKTGVTDLTRHNFTFLKKSLGLDQKYEVIRDATNKALSMEIEETKSAEVIEKDAIPIQSPAVTKKVHEANTEGIKSRKTRPKPKVEVDIDAVMKAFERGWQREVVYRNQNEVEVKKKLDIYYYSPEGKKLRSRVEIETHLLRTGVTDLTRNNFTWAREPLGLDEKHEIVRYATPMSASKASHLKVPTPTKSASPTPGSSSSSPVGILKRIRPLKAKLDTSLQESTAAKRLRIKEDGPPMATVRASDIPLATKSSSEAGSPSLPLSKTSIQQLPGHKNISFRTISKATPTKKLVAVPTSLNSSSPASMRTYSRGQLSKIQQQVVDSGSQKGNVPPSNRNQVVYTSSICSRQPPVPRIITPALGRSERFGTFHCTPLCPRGGGNVPSLSCIKCLCLFHPDCCYLPPATLHLIHAGPTKFLCPNCFSENKTNATNECEPLSLGCEPLAYDPTDSESESDEEMPQAGRDTSDYFRVGLIPECPPTPPRSPPPSQEDIQARTAAALESQWIASSHSQDPFYGTTNMQMRPNIPGQQGNPRVSGGGQLLQVQSSGATQRFLFIRASGAQAASQGGGRSNMPTKIFLPTGFPGSQTMPIVLPQKNVSSGQSVSIMPTKIMPTKWTQTGPLPKPKPQVRPPFMSKLVTDYAIMLRIFSYLHIKDLLVASQVSVMWRDLAASPRLWVHVSLRNICVSNWKLLARFMDRRGTQSVDLKKMRMKAPQQKTVLENERRDSISPIKDKTKEVDQGVNIENSDKDKQIEESIRIKEEVMDVDENLAETKNGDDKDSMTDESKKKKKNSDVSPSPMEVNDSEEGKNVGNNSDVKDVTESKKKSDNESENTNIIKEKEIKTEDVSSLLKDKLIKDAGAIEQWREICRCLRNMERLRALTLPSCQAEMVHQVLQNCNNLTSLTAIDIKPEKQSEQMPEFDPSYLMDASELKELRLASSNGFSFTSNFNFIKLQKLKVLVIRGLSETVWPYLGTNLTTLHIGPLRNFTAVNWSNIGAMKNLEALWLEDGGNLQDISVHEALHQLTCLKRLCLFNFVVGPRLHLAVKKMTKLQKVFVLPSKEIDTLSTQNGHMLSVAENTKQCSELVWAIWADEVIDKDGNDSIAICPTKVHLKMEGSKRPSEGTEIWSFKKLHGIVSKNLPRSTVRIMKLEQSHATLMALNTL